MFVVKGKLNVPEMERVGKITLDEKYCVWDRNCVNAVVRTLHAGGLRGLGKYTRLKVPHPSKLTHSIHSN